MEIKKPKIGVIVQARMSSTRLPGKSMMLIQEKPLVWHVIERLKKSEKLDEIILATSIDLLDQKLKSIAQDQKIPFFTGDLNDVLDRYYNAAKEHNLDIIVRVTGDCPLIDPYLLDDFVNEFIKGNYDYLSNGQKPWADGFDIEVFTFSSLENAWKNAKLASEREHVTPHIRKNASKIKYIENDPRLSEVHCSVDNQKDFDFVKAIYSYFLEQGKDHSFTQKEVIELLEKNLELKKINKESVINEGYQKSLKEDKEVK